MKAGRRLQRDPLTSAISIIMAYCLTDLRGGQKPVSYNGCVPNIGV